MLEHLTPSPVPPTRVVVIGGKGFVGSEIASRLEKDGVPILRLTRQDVDLLSQDADKKLASLLRDGDSVVAVSAIAPCKTPQMLKDNVTLSIAIMTALRSIVPSHVVNISSDAVYADLPIPLTEETPKAPNSYHGIMHLAREIILQNEISAPLAILRPTLIYGDRDPHNGYGPNQFRRKAHANEHIVLFGEGEERRDHIAVDDVAELVRRVLYRRSVGSLNLATGEVSSFRNLAELVVRLSGRTVEIKCSPRTGPMPHNGFRPFDITACRRAFPDFTFKKLADGLAEAQKREFPNG